MCPVRPGTRLWLLSPRGAIAALVAGCELDAARLDSRAPINLPGVCVTAQDMARALREVAGDTVADRIHWEPDARRAHRRQLAGPLGHVPGRMAGAVGRRQLRRHHPGLHRRRPAALSAPGRPSSQLIAVTLFTP